ncbi:MAG: SpoIIE family protein phosphatase [Candidatus Riflebacteria bacterium]|nr:SpoIIE family protein phosphatase [Candidatus Riflebacteria bacterium]
MDGTGTVTGAGPAGGGLGRRFWLLTAALWGFPAFCFWLGVGVLLGQFGEWEMQAKAAVLEKALGRYVDQARLPVRIGQVLEREYRAVVGRPSAEVAPWLAGMNRRYPEGLIAWHVFDGKGRLLTPCSQRHRPVLERLFRSIREPWDAWRPESVKEVFLPLEGTWLDSPVTLAVRLRGQPGQVREVLPAGTRESSFPDWAWFMAEPGARPGNVGGLLCLIRSSRLPLRDLLRESAPLAGEPGVGVGFFSPDEGIFELPQLLAAEAGPRFIGQSRARVEARFPFEGFLVETRPFEDRFVLAAVTPLPEERPGILLLVFLPYALLSFTFLRRLADALRSGHPVRLPLGWKLGLLFVLGLVLPLAVSGSLAGVYLSEKAGQIREEALREGTRELDRLDAGFDLHLAEMERLLAQTCAATGAARLSEQGWKDFLGGLEERFLMDRHFLIASTGRLVDLNMQDQPVELLAKQGLPWKERVALVDLWVRRGWTQSHFPLAEFLHPGVWTNARTSTLGRRQREMVRVLSAFTSLIIDRVDGAAGLSNGRNRPSLHAMAVGAISEDPIFPLARSAHSNLGEMRLVESPSDRGYYYTDVIRGADGRGQYCLFTRHTLYTLQAPYLEGYFRNLPPRPGISLVVIGREKGCSPVFPDDEAETPFAGLVDHLRDSGATTLVQDAGGPDGDSLVIVRKAAHLRENFLCLAIGGSHLAARLRPFRTGCLALVATTTLLAFLLALVLWQRLVWPVGDLVEALAAMRERKLGFRLPPRPADELGRLCEAFNNALAALRDMEVAAVVQARLLPPGPVEVGPFLVGGRNLMTSAVGGDYFDLIPLGEGRLGVVLGDVSGHGVAAALVTAMAKGSFSVLLPHFAGTPDALLHKVNGQFLGLLHKKKMMTCLLGILDTAADPPRLVMGCAGQCSPVLVPAEGEPTVVDLPSQPLGVIARARFQVREIPLVGTAMVWYSDGLIEAQNERQEPVGYAMFSRLAAQACREGKGDPIGALFQAVREFTGPVPWADDATALFIIPRAWIRDGCGNQAPRV